jgi:low temperature requirement protein LtrA
VSETSKPYTVSREDRLPQRFVRPQSLRNLTSEQRGEERTSTWLELFFDLCFVVAVAALARGLHAEPTLGGMLRFLSLFVPVWWSWMVGLFLLGIAFVDRVNEGTTNDRVLLARLGAVLFLVPVTALGSLLSPLAFTATVSLVLLALTVYETLSADPQAESSAS